MDYSKHYDVRFTLATSRVRSQPQRRQQSRRNPNFVPRRCTICRDKGIQSDLFNSRGQVTERTKVAHGCWYNPYGDRYIPIDPDQLAEGRARKIARQVEQKHRQLRRKQAEREPDVITCGMLPPRGRGRGILRIHTALTETTPVPGSSSYTVPSVGRRSLSCS